MGCIPSVPRESREFSQNRRRGEWAVLDWIFFLSFRRDAYDRHVDRISGIKANVRSITQTLKEYIEIEVKEVDDLQRQADETKSESAREGFLIRVKRKSEQLRALQELCAGMEDLDTYTVRGLALNQALVCMSDLQDSSIIRMTEDLGNRATKDVEKFFAAVQDGEGKFKRVFQTLSDPMSIKRLE